MPRIAPAKTANARRLRREATVEEKALWERLRYIGRRFTLQLPVGPYILDFACRAAKLAIELDGSQHLDASTYDAQRTAFLEGLGWQVLRFWNGEVREMPMAWPKRLWRRFQPASGQPTPNPSLSGRGIR